MSIAVVTQAVTAIQVPFPPWRLIDFQGRTLQDRPVKLAIILREDQPILAARGRSSGAKMELAAMKSSRDIEMPNTLTVRHGLHVTIMRITQSAGPSHTLLATPEHSRR
ncbi:MAG TPA: hypothetical protein PKC49_14635, partial [Phycisphaerae bacterium]|nr:hypothetical protein [Phycisphaerae bacterium]